MEVGLEEEVNASGDNQNTLLLDSQSIIIEGGDGNNQHNKDANLSL